MSARFAVGIDLGTTHTALAFAPIGGGAAQVFDIPQLVGPAEVSARPVLASTLYAPLDGETAEDAFGDGPWVLGAHARRRGSEVAGRMVASSKSWLLHPSVDKVAPILPWGAEEGAPKISPVEAAARILAHLRTTWDAANPDAPLAEQEIVLTVPASFDEYARELTVEAARQVDLTPRLLEEPQAAFYDWMARSGPRGLQALLDATRGTKGDALVLVVDVGGGTTDLSLLRVSEVERITRVAVGPHLLLGGDNMDLAIAHALEARLGDDGKLDPARLSQLVAQCRDAKEKLLGDAPPDDAPVTVVSPGAKLVGGTRTTRLSREEAADIVLSGFLPLVPADARPQRARGALVGFGLPYERDAAITRHVAAFVADMAPGESSFRQGPHAVLLNGGVFRAERIAQRMVDAMSAWRGGAPVVRLPDVDPDLAVARGAVAYALARRGLGVRIGGGSARGYFIAVDEAKARAVCVVPRGAEEGVTHGAQGRIFALATGRPVRFDLLASDRIDAAAGDVVDVDEERFARLPPIATVIAPVIDAAVDASESRVAIEGELSPIGTVDLSCVEVDGRPPRRFRLAFQLRERTSATPPARLSRGSERAAPRPVRPSDAPIHASPPFERARQLLEGAFGKARSDAGGREAKDLLRELEKALGDRSQWTMQTSRALFDALMPLARARRRSPDHERIFWLLAGWCVRPGFGDALDSQRVADFFALVDERLAFPGEARGWQSLFIALRRAAAGMNEPAQKAIRDLVDPYLAPSDAGLKRPKKPALSLDDALDMAASLERVAVGRRVALGTWILERTWTDRDPRLWVALGRVGARVPAYASVHHVVPAHAAERWIDHLLREKWDAVPAAMAAAVQMTRLTGDRARDVGDRVRREVEGRLIAAGADAQTLRAVREVVEVDETERVAFFGDALPLGLRLVE